MASDLANQQEAIMLAAEISMSQRDLAEHLDWGIDRVRSAVRQGRICAVHVGRSIRIPLAEVQRLEALAAAGVPIRQAQEDTDGPPGAA